MKIRIAIVSLLAMALNAGIEEAEDFPPVKFMNAALADAEPLYKRALAIKEKTLGPEHPHVAKALANYAALLRRTGRSTEAAKMEARAKAIRAKHAR